MGCAAALAGTRGAVFAWRQSGRYPWDAWASDAAALLVVALLVRGLDLVLDRAASWLQRRASVLTRLLRVGVLLAAVGPVAFVGAQLHPPRVAPTTTPASVGLAFESVHLDSGGLRLAGWWIPPAEPRQAPAVVVLVHGLGANRAAVLWPALALHRAGFHVLAIDLRAHGDSEGLFSTLGEREAQDVRAAHDFAALRVPGARVQAVGYSMGASAVLRAAARDGLFESVVADSPYARLEHVAQEGFLRHLGPLAGPAWSMLRGVGLCFGVDAEAGQPDEAARSWRGQRLLLIHGTGDRTIPARESEALYSLVPNGRARLWLEPGAAHIAAMSRPGYAERLVGFLEGR